MEQLLNRIAQVPTAQKLALLGMLIIGMLAGYYYLVYADIMEEQRQNEETIKKQKKEEDEYKKRVEQYKAYVMEVNQLRDEQKELLRILPQNDDIEQFIEGVNSQVEGAGLSKVSQVREESRKEEIYLRIPIRMSLVGGFHQIDKFFKNVAEMQRIVTIAELQLQPADQRSVTQNGAMKADFVAQTFQLVEAPKTVAPPPGAAGAAGATGATGATGAKAATPAPAKPAGGAK